jgi:two-component system cell cycle sensor histidine kinase/response regulator CckA
VTSLVVILVLAIALVASLAYSWRRSRRPAVVPAPVGQPSQASVAAPVGQPSQAPPAAPVEQPLSSAAAPAPPAAAATPSQPSASASANGNGNGHQPARGEPGHPGTVLLVDDDDDVRGSTARILARAGFEVLEATSAAEALEVWHRQETPIDVVLSDVVMPGVSGVQLAAAIAALSPGASTILISGFTPSALERHRVLSDDSDDVQLLQKPLAPEELLAAVRDAISAGRSRAA